MIDTDQIKKHVIIPALDLIEMGGPDAVELVFNTGLVESRYKYIAQVGGPALSFWQVEPTTMYDIFMNYLQYRQDLYSKIMQFTVVDTEFQLATNMAFAAAMCRLKYRRSPMPLPDADDIEGQAFIWKQVYNSPQGKGTEEKFIQIVNSFRAVQ